MEADDWMLGPLPSGRHGLSREDVARSQRLRLVRAAIFVAGSEGYAAMSVSAVIARANVSRKTFYEQFADREQCFLAAYDHLTRRALDGLHAAFASEAAWSLRVHAALEWALDALARHPPEAHVAFVEVLAAGPRALARRDRALRAALPLFTPALACVPDGVVVPASMPAAVLGGLCELIAGRLREGAVEQLPHLLPDAVYCALAPFVGPADAQLAAMPRATAGAHLDDRCS